MTVYTVKWVHRTVCGTYSNKEIKNGLYHRD